MALPSITHLTDPESFSGDRLEVADEAYRHLFRSRRLAVGAELRIVDGLGSARHGRVVEVDRRTAHIELGDPLPSYEPDRHVHLKVGALRPERADWLVEKATELGVSSVTFVACERTPRQYGKGRLDRQRRVATAALEQCRRSRLPEIQGVVPWAEALAAGNNDLSFVLDADGELPAAVWLDLPSSAPVTLWVGPEGGLSGDEMAALESAGAGKMRLGPTVLRVETAAVAALAALLAR